MCFFSFKIGSVINLPHKILVLLKWEDLEALSIVPGNSKSSITFGYFYLISKTPSKSPCQVGHPTQKRSRIFIMLLKRRIRVLIEEWIYIWGFIYTGHCQATFYHDFKGTRCKAALNIHKTSLFNTSVLKDSLGMLHFQQSSSVTLF